jgi:hypothetical protein
MEETAFWVFFLTSPSIFTCYSRLSKVLTGPFWGKTSLTSYFEVGFSIGKLGYLFSVCFIGYLFSTATVCTFCYKADYGETI